MVALLWILSIVAGIAGFAGFVWLVVHAFRESALWGVLVLLLSPITATIFAVRNWQESKKPFLLYGGGVAANIVLTIAVVVTVGVGMSQEMQAQLDSGAFAVDREATPRRNTADEPAAVPAAERQQSEAILVNRDATADDALDPSILAELLPETGTAVAPRGYVRVPFAEAGRHLGKKTKVVEPSGHEFVGRLEKAGANSIVLSRSMASGTATVKIRRGEVGRLMVYFP